MTKRGENSYDELFLTYYKLLCVHAFFYLKDQDEAKDLVQTLFIELWEKKLFLNLQGDKKAYLLRAVQYRCLNHLRNQDVRMRRQLDYEHQCVEVEDVPLSEDRYNVLSTLVATKLPELSPQRREALRMVYVENKKYSEAAADMGISINSLKTHLKIGLQNLREKVKNIGRH